MEEVYGEGNDVRYTRSKDGKTVYVFFTKKIIEPIVLEHLPFSKNYTISLLGSKVKVEAKDQDGKLQLRLPQNAEGQYVWTVKLTTNDR